MVITDRTITIAAPPDTYEPFQRYAERSQWSVEEAIVAAMCAVLGGGADSATDRQAMLDALDALDTAALWQVIQRGAEDEESLLLRALNERRDGHGLSETDERLVRELIRSHDRAVLVRAKALALLLRRGEDVSAVLAPG